MIPLKKGVKGVALHARPVVLFRALLTRADCVFHKNRRRVMRTGVFVNLLRLFPAVGAVIAVFVMFPAEAPVFPTPALLFKKLLLAVGEQENDLRALRESERILPT